MSALGSLDFLIKLIWLGFGSVLSLILVPSLVLTLKSLHRVWRRKVRLRNYTLISACLVLYLGAGTIYLMLCIPNFPLSYFVLAILAVLAISIRTRKLLVKSNAV